MMMILFLLVLHSGFLQFTLSANRLRSFRHTGRLTWDAALRNCTDTSDSMVTLYDGVDAEFLSNYRNSLGPDNPSVWLGLHKARVSVTTWSNGAVPNGSEFKTPTEVSGGEQKCGAAESGTWHSFTCSDKRYFMCQKGKEYILIEKEKDWCQALQYCRTHFTDLAIINDAQEAADVQSKSQSNSFWIGLLHDEWEWVDQSCSTYRTREKPLTGNCTALSSKTGNAILNYDCSYTAIGLCSKGRVRLKVITEPRLTWEGALNYCERHHSRLLWIEDEEDQQAVQQWLTFFPGKTGPFWIGIKQSTLFGFWIWSDRVVNWNNWEGGTQPELDRNRTCGVINEDFTWSNADCSTQLPFICEEDI